MRRTKGGWLHPAIKWKLGEQGIQRFVSDPAGVMRVEEPGSIWDYVAYEPDIDVNHYHHQIDFKDASDTDTSKLWVETSQTTGTGGDPLTVRNWQAGGHATVKTANGTGDYYQYQQRNMAYFTSATLGGRSDLWFMAEGGLIPSEGTKSFIGYSEQDANILDLTRPATRIGFYSDENESDKWQFIITAQDEDGVWQELRFETTMRTAYHANLGFRLHMPEVERPIVLCAFAVNDEFGLQLEIIPDSIMFWDLPLHLTIAIGDSGLSTTESTMLLAYLKQIFTKLVIGV